MRKAKERNLLFRMLKDVYCANSLVATLLRAIGIIASGVLAIVFLKDFEWWIHSLLLRKQTELGIHAEYVDKRQFTNQQAGV